MILTDVNVLVDAFRAPDHRRYRRWVEALIGQAEAFGVAALALQQLEKRTE